MFANALTSEHEVTIIQRQPDEIKVSLAQRRLEQPACGRLTNAAKALGTARPLAQAQALFQVTAQYQRSAEL